jgi:hypothetical protein
MAQVVWPEADIKIIEQLAIELTKVLNGKPEFEILMALTHTMTYTIYSSHETQGERMKILEYVIDQMLEDLKDGSR